MVRFLYFGLIVLLPHKLFSQDQLKLWYFGNNAGIDFRSGTAIPDTNNIVAMEGSATICDASGQLLFYSNGINIWDKNGNLMPNGTGIYSGASSSQAPVFIPIPKSCTRYYMFTTEDETSTLHRFCYSIVDMSLNGGLGDIDPSYKNVVLNTNVRDAIACVKHGNGTDIWIITHALGGKIFYAQKIDNGGIQYPIFSSIGYGGTSGQNVGNMEFNHAGTKLVVSCTYGNSCEMFDFDKNTGVVSNLQDIKTLYSMSKGPFGIQFSPDDQLLYITTIWDQSHLFQIDLNTGVKTPLQDILNDSRMGQLQLGPDNKIYMSRSNQSFLGLIQNPNGSGIACNFDPTGFTLWPGTKCLFGLPNHFPFEEFVNPQVDQTSLDTICYNESIVLHADTINGSYTWNNGSTIDSIFTDSAGIYWVDIDILGCVHRDSFLIFKPNMALNLNSGGSICESQTTLVYVSPNTWDQYQWSTGQTTDTIIFNGNSSEYVLVTVTDSIGCSKTDSIMMIVHNNPNVQINHDSACTYEYITFTATTGSGNSIQWNTGETTGSVEYPASDLPDTVWVFVTNNQGCKDSTYILGSSVNVFNSPLAYFDTLPAGPFAIQTYFSDSSSSDVIHWNWAFGDGTNSSLQNPNHQYSQEGEYHVELIVENNYGCFDTSMLVLNVSENSFIPNVFSPNGDGKNEFFLILLANHSNQKLIIYDRWGLKLYESPENNLYWDGRTISGNKATDGTYYYIVTSGLGQKPTISGYVSLLR